MASCQLDSALALARHGFRVFPLCEGGKLPRDDRWQHWAKVDPDGIRDGWTNFLTGEPQDWNIGVSAERLEDGPDLLVLDVDVKGVSLGDVSLAQLEQVHGALPATWVVITASGGRHHYFTSPHAVSNSAGKLGDGLDIRGQGGYLVAPGSVIDGQGYEWASGLSPADLQIAPAPAWLLAMTAAAPAGSKPRQAAAIRCDDAAADHPAAMDRAREYLRTAEEAVEGAGGDHHTFQVACAVRDFGVSESACLDLMLDHWNERCSPPWDPDELSRKVSNAYQYARGAIGNAAPAEVDFTPIDPEEFTSPDVAATATRKKLFGLFLSQMRLATERPVLVSGLLDQGGMTVIYGDSNVGKTFVALDLAGHIAAGKPWGGREVKQGLVAYVAAEAGRSAETRAMAMMTRLSSDNVPFFLIPCPVNLLDAKADTADLVALVKDAEQATQKHCELVVIDTLARAFAGGNENDSADMGAFVANCDRIRTGLKSAVMIVHHSGKNAAAGARGHSSLRAATDTELEVTAAGVGEDAIRTLTPKKQRDMEIGLPIDFALRSVSLGLDSRGRDISSCIVALQGEPGFEFADVARIEKAQSQQRAATDLATHLATVMPSDRCGVSELLQLAAQFTGDGNSKTREAIKAAIPETGRVVITDRGCFSIRMERRGSHGTAPLTIVRTRVIEGSELLQ